MSQPPARARKSAATKASTPKRASTVKLPPAPQGATGKPPPRLTVPVQDRPDMDRKTPLWEQIADDLRARIESGELKPGQLIASEAELITAYGTSRPTARQAVAYLRRTGLVVTEHGRGTRVRPSAISAPAAVVVFNPTVIRDGSTFTTWDATDWESVHEPALFQAAVGDYSHLLQLPQAEPTFVYERQLIHTNGARILHRLVVPMALTLKVASLAADPLLTPDLAYQILTDAGYTLGWRDTLHAELPTHGDTVMLEIPDGVPMMIHTRVTHAADGRPLILEETRLPADRATVMSRPVQ
jgi:GntR family transcriptional regulator